MSVETTAAGAANATARIPANLMSILRQAYGARERQLDWLLAIGVTAAMVYVFRGQLLGVGTADNPPDPNAGRDDAPYPNQDLPTAFPVGPKPYVYSYNMPASRTFAYGTGPSATRPPANPSLPPDYDPPE